MDKPTIVDRDTWLEKRQALLEKEKAFTRARDELSAERRTLPWVQVDEAYEFKDASGSHTLADLFGSHSQLMIYHFMYGENWKSPCSSCSFWADNFNGIDIHLAHRDIAFMAVSTAPFEMLEALKARFGWSFRWVSAGSSQFNQDFHVTFSDADKERGEKFYNYRVQPYFIDELPGISVFAKNEQGQVFHTYSTYSRGLDLLNGAYNYMDLAPKGRDEGDEGMKWLRMRDQYD